VKKSGNNREICERQIAKFVKKADENFVKESDKDREICENSVKKPAKFARERDKISPNL